MHCSQKTSVALTPSRQTSPPNFDLHKTDETAGAAIMKSLEIDLRKRIRLDSLKLVGFVSKSTQFLAQNQIS